MKFNGKNLIPNVREERVFRIEYPVGTDLSKIRDQLEKEDFRVIGYENQAWHDKQVLIFRTLNQDLSEETVSYIMLKYGGRAASSDIKHVYLDKIGD